MNAAVIVQQRALGLLLLCTYIHTIKRALYVCMYVCVSVRPITFTSDHQKLRAMSQNDRSGPRLCEKYLKKNETPFQTKHEQNL